MDGESCRLLSGMVVSFEEQPTSGASDVDRKEGHVYRAVEPDSVIVNKLAYKPDTTTASSLSLSSSS